MSLGENVVFTITTTNLGTTVGTDIEVLDLLPLSYEIISAEVTSGTFDPSSNTWNIPSLSSNQMETLYLTAKVVSSINLLNIALLNRLNEPDMDSTNNEDSASVTINNCLNVPQGFSPNNDNANDVLIIPCIENYPQNLLQIYNRHGKLVFKKDSYSNTWNGIANVGFPKGSLLPVGTYYYVLSVDNIEKPIIGYVYLNY